MLHCIGCNSKWSWMSESENKARVNDWTMYISCVKAWFTESQFLSDLGTILLIRCKELCQNCATRISLFMNDSPIIWMTAKIQGQNKFNRMLQCTFRCFSDHERCSLFIDIGTKTTDQRKIVGNKNIQVKRNKCCLSSIKFCFTRIRYSSWEFSWHLSDISGKLFLWFT